MNNLKKLITAHLRKTEEATAKQIAAAIGYRESQSSVNNALNAPRDGVPTDSAGAGRSFRRCYVMRRHKQPAIPVDSIAFQRMKEAKSRGGLARSSSAAGARRA